MPLKIDDFRAYFSSQNEVSKADKFDVWITVPQSIQGSIGMKELSTQCDATTLPGRDIVMREYTQWAFQRRVPMHNQFGHIDLQFICTGNLVEKKLFDSWIDLLVPVNTGYANYAEDDNGNRVYEADILINQYDQAGKGVYSVVLQDAVPVNVQPMSLDWSNDQIHRLSVTFAFVKWYYAGTTPGGTTESPGGGYTNLGGSMITNGIGGATGGFSLNNYVNGRISSLDQRLPPQISSLIPSLQSLGVPSISVPTSVSISADISSLF